MNLSTKELNKLQPVTSLKRVTVSNSSLVIELKPTGFSILCKYRSPITYKIRLKKSKGFDYGAITKGDMKLVNDKALIYINLVEIQGADPMEKVKPIKNS